MNTESHSDDSGARDEWEAQERAFRDERRGVAQNDDDSDAELVAQYRLVDRALRKPPVDPIPNDFAYRTAAWVEKLAEAADDRFESSLQRALIAALVVASIATIVLFGKDWLPAFVTPLRQSSELNSPGLANWSVVVAICVGLSWAVERWRGRADAEHFH
jgi:hypothetical protein